MGGARMVERRTSIIVNAIDGMGELCAEEFDEGRSRVDGS